MNRARIQADLKVLKKLYPEPHHFLEFRNVYELMVATILSAQTPDKTVNTVTPGLFEKFPVPEKLARADLAEIESLIRKLNFYRNKAKSIRGAARMIGERFQGKVPNRMEDLLELPGVARKTANVILQQGFNQVEGIVVDTHVIRVAFRLGWTANKDPEKIETDLMGLLPRPDWQWLHFYLKSFGTEFCRAPRPKCGECPLKPTCPSALKV
ncbi:MAG: endonuclease III [bacterium]|nr:endonuclease III [bacterium]